MKLRFDHQSIRLRVRKSDLEKLSNEGFIQETVCFPQGSLVYRLESDQTIKVISTQIEGNVITVSIPLDEARHWIESEEVGLYSALPVSPKGQLLQVIIEKDFPCKHGSAADNADTFDGFSNP